MGIYTMQEQTNDGRPVYKGGILGDMCMWYVARRGEWFIGPENSIGMDAGYIFVKSPNAATPDLVTGTWHVSEGYTPCKSLVVTAMRGERLPSCTLVFARFECLFCYCRREALALCRC